MDQVDTNPQRRRQPVAKEYKHAERKQFASWRDHQFQKIALPPQTYITRPRHRSDGDRFRRPWRFSGIIRALALRAG